jgi:transcriptional regulator with XRE-family HTH domain
MQKKDTWDSSFARGMKEIREQLGKSQQWLAEAMRSVGYDWHQSTVYKAENGSRKVTVGEAIAIADVLNVELDHLLSVPKRKGQHLARMVWNSADELVGTLLQMEELAREAHEKRQLLRRAIEALNDRDSDSTEADADAYASLVAFTGHEDYWNALALALESPQFQDIASDTRGISDLGTAPWAASDAPDHG